VAVSRPAVPSVDGPGLTPPLWRPPWGGECAAAAYVVPTRGRYTNTLHIVAGSVDEAREKWVQAAGRNRADLGLDQARGAASTEARNYAAITEPGRRREPVGGKRPSFTERMRLVSARLADDQARDVTAVDAPAAHDEWDDSIDEHQDHDTPRQAGRHL
jgi:hypothetical protein